MFSKEDLIVAHNRKQAIEDGLLIDASREAFDAGFFYPLALTKAAWCELVAVPEGASDETKSGNLKELLAMLRFYAQMATANGPASEIQFSHYVFGGGDEEPRVGNVKAVLGPDDEGRRCITVMLPGED